MVTPRVEERFNLEVIKKKKERKNLKCSGLCALGCQPQTARGTQTALWQALTPYLGPGMN
jgi:hypothetical protein